MAPAGAEAPGQGQPAFFEFRTEPHWQAVDFVSDLHLCAALPRTCDALIAHLMHTPADAVVILGDLFEAWVGDDSADHGFEAACTEMLAECATRRQLAVMVGNRDFLLGTEWLQWVGAQGLPDPTVLVAWGQRVLLTHGDALCLDDKPYQQFRRMVRSLEWQQPFLARPLAERQRLAREMRAASQARQAFDGDLAHTDVDAAEAVRWMHLQGAMEMVHGHTHRPASHTLAPGYRRHVLSDWDLDHGERGEVLRLTRDGFSRHAPSRRPAGA
jgi:UDP-2,3-diacylglucosamine hydrolase